MSIIAVYMITDELSKKFYIGSTSDLNRRISEHKSDLKNNMHYNKKLQELYNNKAKLKIHHIEKETIQEARELEDILLKQSETNPNLLNISITTYGNGLNRHPDKINIINKIQKGRKKHWEDLSIEEKNKRLNILKEKTSTSEAKEKRKISFRKYIESTPLEERRQSVETIEKRRKSLIGRIVNQETRDKISLANRGKLPSIETKYKMTVSRKKYLENNGPNIVSKETREKISIANTGKKHTEETKKKISEQKKLWNANRSPEERKHTEETKQLLSQKHKGKIITEEQKRKMSEAKKRFLDSMSPEELKAYKDRLANSRKKMINPSL